MPKKASMVAPKPRGPIAAADELNQLQLVDTSLAVVLSSLGNDRSYVLISQRPNGWLIHFEGDYDHSLVEYKNGKFVITPAKS